MNELDKILQINACYETFRTECENAIRAYNNGYITALQLTEKLSLSDIQLSEKLKSIR